MRNDVTIMRQTDEEFLVIHAGREHLRGNAHHPYFTVGADLYSSRRAFELGNSGAIIAAGCMHEDVLRVAPELADVVALHLADAETGEPMHGPASGWYRLSGADMAHELKAREQGHRSYYQAPEPYDADGNLAPEFARFFVDMAARSLGVGVDELPDVQDEAEFLRWVDDYARPRWQAAADRVNAWLDEHANTVEIPAEQIDEEGFYAELDAGLIVTAELMDEEGYRDVGCYFQYRVIVTDAQRHRYSTVYGGSVADYEDGKRNAREAAFGVLRELADFGRYDSAEEYAEEMGMEWPEMSAAERKPWRRAWAAADRMADALEANAEVIGS